MELIESIHGFVRTQILGRLAFFQELKMDIPFNLDTKMYSHPDWVGTRKRPVASEELKSSSLVNT
jgi:hypothetical protein